MEGSPNTFDPDRLATALDAIRDHWNEAPAYHTRKSRGFLNNILPKSPNEQERFSWDIGKKWDPASNHARIVKLAWIARLNHEAAILDSCLRSIPTFDRPRLKWQLNFQHSSPRVSYKFLIMTTPLSSRFVTTSAHAAKKLSETAEKMAAVQNFLNNRDKKQSAS